MNYSPCRHKRKGWNHWVKCRGRIALVPKIRVQDFILFSAWTQTILWPITQYSPVKKSLVRTLRWERPGETALRTKWHNFYNTTMTMKADFAASNQFSMILKIVLGGMSMHVWVFSRFSCILLQKKACMLGNLATLNSPKVRVEMVVCLYVALWWNHDLSRGIACLSHITAGYMGHIAGYLEFHRNKQEV